MRHRRVLAATIVIITAGFGTGCWAHGRMQTTRHLEQGEVQGTVAMEFPGSHGIPRVNGGATMGYGGGDVDAYADVDFYSAGVGAGFRKYIGDLAHLELDLRYRASLGRDLALADDIDPVDTGAYLDVVSPAVGVESSVESGYPFYAGVHLRGRYPGPIEGQSGTPNPRIRGLSKSRLYPTFTLGYESVQAAVPIQIEWTLPVLGYQGIPVPYLSFIFSQFSIGFHF